MFSLLHDLTSVLLVTFQSLWNIRRFREEFLRRSTSRHVHVGGPCVTCALFEIFNALNVASTDLRREAVAPTCLRIALSNLYPDSNFFQEVNYRIFLVGLIFCILQVEDIFLPLYLIYPLDHFLTIGAGEFWWVVWALGCGLQLLSCFPFLKYHACDP